MEQDKTLTLGSLFDGSGGFPFGGILSGITPVWASEIEQHAHLGKKCKKWRQRKLRGTGCRLLLEKSISTNPRVY